MPAPRQEAQSARGDHPAAGHGSARIRGVIDARAAEGFLPALRMTGPVTELTDDIVTDLLALLREALTNVARHARADSAYLAVAVTGTDVTLRVRDDGVGLAAAPRRGARAWPTSAGVPAGTAER